MSRKRTVTKLKPTSGTDELQAMLDKSPTPAPLAFMGMLQNVSGNPVTIRAESTPSGSRYHFNTGAIQEVGNEADYQYLKSLTFDAGSGCCGNQPHAITHYFAEV